MILHRLVVLCCLAAWAQAGEAWVDQVEQLLRHDSAPTAWQALVHESDPGDRVPADARQRWLSDWRRESEQDTPRKPGPPTAARDDLGVPYPTDVRDDPERLIPEVVRFIGDPERHDRAVTCLIQFHLTAARADALRPLVPWLADPNWSKAEDRLRLIQSLDRIILPEAEPGLLRVLEHETGYEQAAAADALASMRCTPAIPLLRRLTSDGTDLDHHLMGILRARAALGGFTEDEALQALEAWARAGDDVERFSPVVCVAGVVSGTPAIATDALARRVLARVAGLGAEPAVAQRLRERVTTWRVPAALDAFLDDLAAGEAGTWPLLEHLADPGALRQQRGERLRLLAQGTGVSAGLAVILSGDVAALERAFTSTNAALLASVCAAGRVSGAQPPGVIASALGHPSPVVQRAALMWASETTDPAVRAAIHSHQPGQMILGRLPGWDPGHHTKDGFTAWEDRLRQRFREPDPPTRILALLSGSYWGETGQMIIEERATGARLILAPDRDRYRIRDLSAEELAIFRQSMDRVDVGRLPAAEFLVHDGIQYEHVELTSAGGFRVWMNNPETRPASPWDILVHAWFALAEPTAPVIWPVLDTIPGARVLYDGGLQGLPCAAVDGSDGVRVLRRSWRRGEIVPGSGWYRLTDGMPTPCDPPPRWPVIRAEEPKDFHVSGRRGWQALVSGSEVVEGNPYGESRTQGGLWWLLPDKPVLIVAGMYRAPLAIPGTTTVLVEKVAGAADETVFAVVDCPTGKTSDCGALPPGNWKTLGWVAARQAFLLESWEPDARVGSSDPAIAAEGEAALALGGGLVPTRNSRLLWFDPRTGVATPTTGEAAPLRDLDHRPLQPVLGREELMWAALPTRHGTRIGHYDPAKLIFTAVAQIDGLDFSSQECWVDEAGDRLLLSLRGDLLSVPLARLRLPAASP